ncbi:hypothetical protein KR009_000956 [Drosophila setifemur]|nr:hypothetical protein KR009_000956 [Drosophila setifemur]
MLGLFMCLLDTICFGVTCHPAVSIQQCINIRVIYVPRFRLNKMPRCALEYCEVPQPKRNCLRNIKLDPKGKCGVAKKQQQQQKPREQPVEVDNPLHFLNRKSGEEIVVHWTRSGSRTFSPIKLLPPW